MWYFNIYLYCSRAFSVICLFAECCIRTVDASLLVLRRLQWHGWVVDIRKQRTEMFREFCFKWCKSRKTRNVCVLVFKILFILFIIVAAVISGTLVWDIDDTFNGLMAFPNLIALVLLSGKVAQITKNYYKRKKGAKIEPMLSAYPELNEQFSRDIQSEEEAYK